MSFNHNLQLSIQICSLAAAKKIDHTIYDGVITIEDSFEEHPLRIDPIICSQLVLKFDDISQPVEGYILPEEQHIQKALDFAENINNGSLLIHCLAGISRSSAIALAIIAQKLGIGKEKQAIKELQRINPYCMPNKLIVWLTDNILKNTNLFKTAKKMLILND